jgi:hypothetical protein
MKSMTEAELFAELTADGTSRQELQERFARALRLPVAKMCTPENADVIIGGRWPTLIRGARRHDCETCDEHVSLAPSSQAVLAIRAVHVICMRCAFTGKADALLKEEKPDA